MNNTQRIIFTEASLSHALSAVKGLHDMSPELIADEVYRQVSGLTAAHDKPKTVWCGSGGLYQSRMAAVTNGEQLIAPAVVLGIQHSNDSTAESINLHLLQIAERSCSLLEDWVQLAGVRDENLTDQIKETRRLLETHRPTWSVGVRDLLTERRRQVQEEGYTLERDDKYTEGQLASAASSYAFWADPRGGSLDGHLDYINAKTPACWPWGPEQWKPANQRLMLIKAGALILAELDRLDRLVPREVHHD